MPEDLRILSGDLSGFPDRTIVCSEIDAIVDALDILDCRNFHLRVRRMQGGFRRPVLTSLGNEPDAAAQDAFCTLLRVDAGANPAEIKLVTAFISDDLLPTVRTRSLPPPQRARLGRRLRFAISPVWQLEHEWRNTKKRLAARARRGIPAPLPTPAGSARPAIPRNASKTPTVLIGMYHLEVGGAESFAIDTARAAAEKHRVIVVTDQPSRHDHRDRFATNGDISVFHMDRHVPDGHENAFITALVSKENVFAIHINHCMSLYSALPGIRSAFPGIGVIDTTHIIEHEDGGFPAISRLYTNHIDCHHVISEELRDYLAGESGAAERTRLGYLTHRATPAPSTSNLDRRETGAPVRVAFIGRMVQQKRPMLFVAAAARIRRTLKERGFETEFVMMGDESFHPALSRLAKRLGLVDCLHFLPPDHGAGKLLADSDILLMTSDVEGIALTGLEAGSAGAIVVSTDVGAHREIVPRSLLLSVRPRDFIEEAAETILRLVADEAFRRDAWDATLRLGHALRSAPRGLDEVQTFFDDARKRAR